MKRYIKDEGFPTLFFLILIGIVSINAALFERFGYSSGSLFAALIVVLSLFVSIEKTYYLAIFSFVFASILKFSASSFSIVPYVYLIIIFRLAIQKRIALKKTPLIAFCLFVVFQFVCVFFYRAPISDVVSFLLSVFFVLYSASYFSTVQKHNQKMLKNACLFLATAVVLNIFLSDSFPNIAYIISVDKQEALETGSRFGALFVEPNEFSQVVLVAIGFLIATFSLYKTAWGKAGVVALALYLGINGVRSNSKSYVLTLLGLLCVLMLLCVIRFFKNPKTSSSFFAFVITLLLGILIARFLIAEVIVPVFDFRNETSDLLTGRGDIWAMYLFALLQRIDVLLMGCGVGNVTGVLRLAGRYSSMVPHNIYLEYIVQFGIVGFMLLSMCWSEAFKQFRQKSIWFWIPAVAFLITAFGISSNSNDCIFITILLLAMPIEA